MLLIFAWFCFTAKTWPLFEARDLKIVFHILIHTTYTFMNILLEKQLIISSKVYHTNSNKWKKNAADA